jgi:hypothetical protein
MLERLKEYLIYIARNQRWLYLILLLSFLPFFVFAVNAFLGANILFSLWFAVNGFTVIFGIFLYLSDYFTLMAVLLETVSLVSYAIREEILGKRFYTQVPFWLFCALIVFMIVREIVTSSGGNPKKRR